MALNRQKTKEDKKMQDKWSLEELYAGYEDLKFKQDLEALDESIREINGLPASLEENEAAVNVKKIIEALETESRLISKLYSFASLRQAADTMDMENASVLGRLYQKMNETAKSKAQLMKYIAKLEDLDAVIESDEKLKAYEYVLRCVKEDDRYSLNDDVEEALAKMDISGGNAWSDLQSYLTSTVKVDYDGKQISLSDVRNLAYDADPSVRKAAYEAELAGYEKIKDSVAFSLNSIKMQANSECELRGYESVLDKSLYQARMKKETLDAMWEAIEEYLPKFHEYLKWKAKVLGHENGLPFYDLFAPMGHSDKKYTIEEAKSYLMNLFEAFNPKLAEVVDRAFEENWIDFYPREGKVGGAFCADIAPIKQFRILTNYGGNFTDIVTLAHELGHGYHDVMVQDNLPLNRDYTMPVAETASTFNENVVMNAAIEQADSDEEKLALIESQLSDATQIICDIYSRFLFEKDVCETRKEAFMSSEDLCAMMLKAQKKAYGDGLDENFLHPYMWLCKSHYYSAGFGFYNYPYAFGGLFAKGIYEKYLQDKENFLPKFNKMLQSTPLMSVEEAAKICDIDLTDKEFWRMSLKAITDRIEEFKRLTSNSSVEERK